MNEINCLRNIAYLVVGNEEGEVLRNVDMVIKEGMIHSIGHGICDNDDFSFIDASRWIIYPGLVNTHHHFFQAFFRNQPEFRWPEDVLSWIRRIYPLFAKLNESSFYHTAIICIA